MRETRPEKTDVSDAQSDPTKAGESEFRPQTESKQSDNLLSNPREKAAIRGDQRGARYFSVTFTY